MGLKEVTAQLQAAELKIDETTVKLDKIGKETDGLKTEVQSLKDFIANMPDAPQELVDLASRIEAKTIALAGIAQAVDDKVEDAAPAETPTETVPGE